MLPAVTVSWPCKTMKALQSLWESPCTSTANCMSSSFDSQRYMPVWARSADGTTRLLKFPSDWRSTPFWGRIFVPSLYQLTCPVESDSSHCREMGQPAMTVFFWSASDKAENFRGGATGLNVKCKWSIKQVMLLTKLSIFYSLHTLKKVKYLVK